MLSDEANILHLGDAVLACDHIRLRRHTTTSIIVCCVCCAAGCGSSVVILRHAHFRKLLDELGLLYDVTSVSATATAMPRTIILTYRVRGRSLSTPTRSTPRLILTDIMIRRGSSNSMIRCRSAIDHYPVLLRIRTRTLMRLLLLLHCSHQLLLLLLLLGVHDHSQ